MHIEFDEHELAFQREVRDFLEQHYPADIRHKWENTIHPDKEDWLRWQRLLQDRGWFAQHWPVAYGGSGWTPTQKYIFDIEAARVGGLPLIPFGVTMVGPIIYTFGNDEQKQRFLPDILHSRVWWCQGFSEPGAGSDLASLKTSARREGDSYLVNGTKTWNTLGHWADWIFCLVRSDSEVAKKQDGISFLLIDMATPGITVSPILTLDGKREVNEVHFDNVRVPVANRVGEEGRGWHYAKLLLTLERTSIAQVQPSKVRLARAVKIATDTPDGHGGCMLDTPLFQHKVARIEVDLLALEYTELRTVEALAAGQNPGPESSILKIRGTQVMQLIDELFVELAGYHALPFTPEQYHGGYSGERVGDWFATNAAPYYFNNRKQSIFGGTNEIQKNIICKAVLGL